MNVLNRIIFLGLCVVALEQPCAAADFSRTVDDKVYHLRSGTEAEWTSFQGKTPHGARLDLRFTAQSNSQEATLFLWQDDVKLDWGVELNGKKLGKLFLMEAPLVHALAIPAGGLREGENVLSIVPPKANDDIFIGRVRVDARSLPKAIHQAELDIDVTEAETGKGLPCRITVVSEDGALAALVASSPQQRLAVRPGVAYTGDGKARIGLWPGSYTAYATRGSEYGLDTKKVTLGPDEHRKLSMQIRREVPTTGLVSSDTHVHTWTHSGHGDATIDERALTLAGEGIDLPIATDHEFLADLSAAASRMGVTNYLTPVVGCETTTAKGHFNSFPIVLGSRIPDPRITDWPPLMQSIRSTPGVQVLILNHPRNVHSNFQPFAATNFNAVTGENLRGPEFTFDAIEVVNSSALQSDWMLNFRDWFALLNYGYRVTAVGSSDGHDVSRYIVGQGRSYISCDDSTPGRINVEAACQGFRSGRVLVSLGLITKIAVNDTFLVGELANDVGEQIRVTVTVSGPSWISADRVELYANGVKIREQEIFAATPSITSNDRKYDPQKTKVTWTIPRPSHDIHLVAIATGPGVTALYWPIARPYQPSSPVWEPRVIGATNPVWVDADGDGKFSSARSYARTFVQQHGTSPSKLLARLATCDEAIAAQVASLCHAAGEDVRWQEFMKALQSSPEAVRQGFRRFAETIR